MPDIYRVTPPNLIKTLPAVKGWIERVVELGGGRYSFWDIARFIDDGSMDLFVVVEAGKIIGCGVLMVEVFPQMRVATVLITAGDDFSTWRDEWVAVCRKWANEHGCKQVGMTGRIGWMRELRGVADVVAAHMVMEA